MKARIVGIPTLSTLRDIFEQSMIQQASKILLESLHVLYSEYMLMNPGRKYRVLLCMYNQYKYSFVPFVIQIYQ